MSSVEDQLITARPATPVTATGAVPQDIYWAPPPQPAQPPPLSIRRWALTAVLAAVALLAGFVVYELWFSGLLESRHQAALLSQFKRSLLLDDTPQLVTPPEGAPLGVIQIPRLGLDQVIVQGISSDDTKSGPGHDPSTPAPGQIGNAVIAARRLTYGAPFRHLDQVRPDDSVYITTRQGQFLYTVSALRTAALGDPSAAAPTGGSRLTLITADSSPGHRRGELVVTATLQAQGLAVPATLPPRPAGQRPGESSGLAGRWGWMLLWGQLLLAALVATAWLYHRDRHRAVVYLLTTPVLIVLAVLFYGAVDSLLPPTL